MAVGAYKDIGRIVAVEVSLNIARNVVFAILGVDLHAQTRVLRRHTELSQVVLYRVVEGYGIKIRSDDAASVRGAEDGGEIDEAAGSELGLTNAERQRRTLGLLLRLG